MFRTMCSALGFVRIRWVPGVALAAAVGIMAGCKTVPSAPKPEPAVAESGPRPCGRVVRVDERERFVVFRIGYPAPSGLEWRVMRHGQPTGVVMFTGEFRGDYAVAEWVEGYPAVGDYLGEPVKKAEVKNEKAEEPVP